MFVGLVLAGFLAFVLLIFFAVFVEKLAAFFDAINWQLVSLAAVALALGGWYLTRA